jgi:hypothetical protein
MLNRCVLNIGKHSVFFFFFDKTELNGKPVELLFFFVKSKLRSIILKITMNYSDF